jgi:hypothetical protein
LVRVYFIKHMEAKEFKPTQQALCPNPQCEEPLDGVAEDWVVAGSFTGHEDSCGSCDARFMAARQRDGKIRFELIEEDEEGNAV